MTYEPCVPSSEQVSARMSRHPRRDTGPELAVRRLLHRMGLRYRLFVPVPSAPRRTIDIAFPRHRLAVFIDGCFWHGCPVHASAPASNSAWWAAKLSGNQARDLDTERRLRADGWDVLRVWEHEDPATAAARIAAALGRSVDTPAQSGSGVGGAS